MKEVKKVFGYILILVVTVGVNVYTTKQSIANFQNEYEENNRITSQKVYDGVVEKFEDYTEMFFKYEAKVYYLENKIESLEERINKLENK